MKDLVIEIKEDQKTVCSVFAEENHIALFLLNVLQYSIEGKHNLSAQSYEEITKWVNTHHTGGLISALSTEEKLTPAQRDRANMMDLKILLTEIEPIINTHDDFKMVVEDRKGRIVIDATFQVEYTQVVIRRIFNHLQKMYEDTKAEVESYVNHLKIKRQENRKEQLNKMVKRMENGKLNKDMRQKIKRIKRKLEDDKL